MIFHQHQVTGQKIFFKKGLTRSLQFRIKQLKILKNIIRSNEHTILAALKHDCKKPATEAYTSEIYPVLAQIDHVEKNIQTWNRPSKVRTSLINLPATSYYYHQPLGTVLIIGPWNYPFGLTVTPLIAALAAGNCSVLKPSELAPSTAHCLHELFSRHFDPGYIAVIEANAEQTQKLIAQGFDFIFFTGGSVTGQKIMQAASLTLTPVALELGGKNPCIIDSNINISVAARRVVWGKFFNAGQTCLAPDYCFVHIDIFENFKQAMIDSIISFYGNDPHKSPDYGRIINTDHYNRLKRLQDSHDIIFGGQSIPHENFIAPTLLRVADWNIALMQEEIFGPLLPLVIFKNKEEIIQRLENKPAPLILYCFSRDKTFQNYIQENSVSGNICFNGTLHRILSRTLPFGGVGKSGNGRYYGKAGFDTFSYQRSVMKKTFHFDFTGLYPPYKTPLSFIKKILPRIL